MGLHNLKVLLELKSDFPVQIKLNRDCPHQFQKHFIMFMMQPREGVFSLTVQLFLTRVMLWYQALHRELLTLLCFSGVFSDPGGRKSFLILLSVGYFCYLFSLVFDFPVGCFVTVVGSD